MYKEKLRELLKEVPEVKEQMNKLEFGCILERFYDGCSSGLYKYINDDEILSNSGNVVCYNKENYKIIGLPLQERFIRMYCENKGIPLTIQNNFLYIFGRKIGKIDNTKDLENQSETFYKELHEALLELNK